MIPSFTPLRSLLWLALALAAASCGERGEQGAVVILDHAYTAEIVATQDNGFASPDGLNWHRGMLYVADEGGSAVRRWTPGRRPETLADKSAGIASPEDLVIDARGSIFFTDDTAGGLWRIDRGGQAARIVGPESGLVSTEGIALAPDGSVLVGEATGRVFRVDPQGGVSEFLGTAAAIRKPESIVFDERGNLYIADNRDDTLSLVTPAGSIFRLIEGRSGFSPETLAYADGALFITDSHHGNLYRYTRRTGLETIAVFMGDFNNVNGVTIDDAGAIYVSIQADLANRRGYLVKLTPR